MIEAIKFYLVTNKLKYIERTGWQYWNVPAERLESIAEHIYGTCMLAIAIHSEYNLNVNIDHVIKMLVCHELEELVIGDNTPFDSITEEEKLEEGRKGVELVLGNLVRKEEYVELLDEFNLKETIDSKFAFYCDKLECDLQAKIYDDSLNIDYKKANEKLTGNLRIQEIVSDGYTSVGDIFIEYDRCRFSESELFSELLNELQNTDTNVILKKINRKK